MKWISSLQIWMGELLPRNAQEKYAYFYFSPITVKYVLWTWKYMTVKNNSHKGAAILLGFSFMTLEIEIKFWVHCGECRKNFRWPGGLYWETICLCKMWQWQDQKLKIPTEIWNVLHHYWIVIMEWTVPRMAGIANSTSWWVHHPSIWEYIEELKDE